MGTGRGGLPCSSGWEDEEATEDAIGLWALVNAALADIFFNPDLVSLLEMQHCASRHHLQESLTVEVTEAQGLDLGPPRGPDGQAEVPLGHHLEGEIVVAWDRAVEPARVVLVHVLLVGDDLSEDDHVVSRQRVRSHCREGWPRLVLDVSGVPFGALQPREARGPHGTSGSWVAHSAWISRGSRVALVSFKATDARLDGRGPCGEKGQVGTESLVSSRPQGGGWGPRQLWDKRVGECLGLIDSDWFCVTLDKCLNLSEPQLVYLYNEEKLNRHLGKDQVLGKGSPLASLYSCPQLGTPHLPLSPTRPLTSTSSDAGATYRMPGCRSLQMPVRSFWWSMDWEPQGDYTRPSFLALVLPSSLFLHPWPFFSNMRVSEA